MSWKSIIQEISKKLKLMSYNDYKKLKEDLDKIFFKYHSKEDCTDYDGYLK